MLSVTLGGFSLYQLFYYFFIYSVMGWAMETVLVSSREHRFVNRGFLNGPLCPIYGVGMCAIIVALTPYQDRLTDVFLGGMIVATAIEYFTGWLMEKLFHAKWWDYSDKKFNFQGRVCLQISIAWGVLSLAIVKIVQPPIAGLVGRLPVSAGEVILYVLLAFFLADVVQATWSALRLSKRIRSLELVKQDLHRLYRNSALYENKEELRRKLETSRLSELLAELSENAGQKHKSHVDQLKKTYAAHTDLRSRSQRRLLKAFPTMRSLNLPKTLESMKQAARQHKKK